MSEKPSCAPVNSVRVERSRIYIIKVTPTICIRTLINLNTHTTRRGIQKVMVFLISITLHNNTQGKKL